MDHYFQKFRVLWVFLKEEFSHPLETTTIYKEASVPGTELSFLSNLNVEVSRDILTSSHEHFVGTLKNCPSTYNID